jgi:glycosyltransferase involved in cell wall biosynthesis
MRKYSLIIPVFNRPDELNELLESLINQTYRNFEIIIIEDGSTIKCDEIVKKFSKNLDIKYFYKENEGQGFARNFGFTKATGDYFIQFDSDVLVPSDYLEIVENTLNVSYLDAFGGPDAAHKSFTDTQKAINYAMTSFFTTGGTRGKSKNLGGQFHPRSFNFGLSRLVFEKVGGYKITRMGEDIEFSIRIINSGFKVGLIDKAFIYHKRRANLGQFYKQLFFFGRARVNIWRFFPEQLKLVHLFPLCFMLFIYSLIIQFYFLKSLLAISISILFLYFTLISLDASLKNKNIRVGILSIPASFIQLFAYGMGFISELFKFKSNPY